MTIAVSGGSLVPRVAGCGKSAIIPLCLCGMIIKITSSTSRTSINGTTFISTKIPRFAPPTDMPMSHLVRKISREEDSHIRESELRTSLQRRNAEEILLAGLELGGDQPDFIDAGAAHDIDCARDLAKQHIAIAFDKGDFLGAVLENLFDARPEIVPGGIFVIDFHLAVGQHLDHYGFVLEFLVLLLIGIRLRHQRIETLRRERSDHHENDQKHEQDVDERDDVHFRHRTALTFTYLHSH